MEYYPEEDAIWYHCLYGDVPDGDVPERYGYLDWICRPISETENIKSQIYPHLKKIIKSIDPFDSSPAITIGNLSLNDTKHKPGKGALAVILTFRLSAKDQGGRGGARFVYSVFCVDQVINPLEIEKSINILYNQFTKPSEYPANNKGRYAEDWYNWFSSEYNNNPDGILSDIENTIANFNSILPRFSPSILPAIKKSSRRSFDKLEILCSNEHYHTKIPNLISRISTELYYSDVKWLAVTSGKVKDHLAKSIITIFPKKNQTSGGEISTENCVNIETYEFNTGNLIEDFFGLKVEEGTFENNLDIQSGGSFDTKKERKPHVENEVSTLHMGRPEKLFYQDFIDDILSMFVLRFRFYIWAIMIGFCIIVINNTCQLVNDTTRFVREYNKRGNRNPSRTSEGPSKNPNLNKPLAKSPPTSLASERLKQTIEQSNAKPDGSTR